MTDLIERIKAAIDEDERVALAVRSDSWAESLNLDGQSWNEFDENDFNHIARHDPARVLRQVEGARKLLESHGRPHECQHLTARGDHSVVDGKPWAFFEPAHTDETGGHCDVILALAEMFGVEP